MKNKAVKTVLEYSLGILFWVVVLYFLYPYWGTIFDAIAVAYGIIYALAFIVGVFFIIVLSFCSLINLIKERNALRKKVQELEGRLGL